MRPARYGGADGEDGGGGKVGRGIGGHEFGDQMGIIRQDRIGVN
jgi:hypothetical protein